MEITFPSKPEPQPLVQWPLPVVPLWKRYPLPHKTTFPQPNPTNSPNFRGTITILDYLGQLVQLIIVHHKIVRYIGLQV